MGEFSLVPRHSRAVGPLFIQQSWSRQSLVHVQLLSWTSAELSKFVQSSMIETALMIKTALMVNTCIIIQAVLIIRRESLLSLAECCFSLSKSSNFHFIVTLWLLDCVVFNYLVDTDCHFILSEGVSVDDFSFNHSSLSNWYFLNRVNKCD